MFKDIHFYANGTNAYMNWDKRRIGCIMIPHSVFRTVGTNECDPFLK